ncbi:nascent polypeptide-associated complex subunit alpha, muscle-specific form-like [Lathamus discolor]|uniref:nascent polypeptide-associated complex subunit alpha, muscle-specific form-like n=1 Tax=Lathamus discolor TaxID=678569 RepID=UPI0032B8289F
MTEDYVNEHITLINDISSRNSMPCTATSRLTLSISTGKTMESQLQHFVDSDITSSNAPFRATAANCHAAPRAPGAPVPDTNCHRRTALFWRQPPLPPPSGCALPGCVAPTTPLASPWAHHPSPLWGRAFPATCTVTRTPESRRGPSARPQHTGSPGPGLAASAAAHPALTGGPTLPAGAAPSCSPPLRGRLHFPSGLGHSPPTLDASFSSQALTGCRGETSLIPKVPPDLSSVPFSSHCQAVFRRQRKSAYITAAEKITEKPKEASLFPPKPLRP